MVNKYIKNLFILACHHRNTDEDLSTFAHYTAKKKKKITVLKISNIIKDFEKLNFLHTAYEGVNKKKRKRKTTIKNCLSPLIKP